jgi:polyisoprenoid-binding protein YceI
MAVRGRLLTWVIAGAIVVVVLAVGVPFAYIHFIEGPAPAPLHLGSQPGGTTSPPAAPSVTPSTSASGGGSGPAVPVAGTWQAGSGSVVGYRVKEVLLGQDNIAVGRTNSVTGQLTIKGTTVTAATFTVKMATIHSDQSQRDAQFDGRIMDVATYPTGTFALTKPISIAPLPASGAVRTYHATGTLTLHGHTRPVSFPLSAERSPAGIKVSGSIPVTFADWSIPNPSFGSFVTTQNHGVLEFLLVLSKP